MSLTGNREKKNAKKTSNGIINHFPLKQHENAVTSRTLMYKFISDGIGRRTPSLL